LDFVLQLRALITDSFIRYDGHRDSILRGDDNKNQRDSSAGTTAEDLMRYFSVSEFKGYDDAPKVS
jgi:DnaJ family protein A protein 5